VNADLVVYPRLLALGIPLPTNTAGVAPMGTATGPAVAMPGLPTDLKPAAVVHLRVINVKRGRAIYFRQIAQEITGDQPVNVAEFHLPQAQAQVASNQALTYFFDKVAGSREVLGPEPAPARKPQARHRTRRHHVRTRRMHR